MRRTTASVKSRNRRNIRPLVRKGHLSPRPSRSRPHLECAFEGPIRHISLVRAEDAVQYLASSRAPLRVFHPLAPPVRNNIQPSFCDRLRRDWNRPEVDALGGVAANGSKAAADALKNNARVLAPRSSEEDDTGSNEL